MTSSARPSSAAGVALTRRHELGLSFLEAGHGTPVVLLHGIPGSALAWATVGERLAGDYRVVMPDLLGFGRSDPPSGDYYMEAQAHRVRELLERLDIAEFVLGGHDFGGPIALTLRRLYPELRIRALILSATNLFTDTYVPPPLRLARFPSFGTPLFWLFAGNRWGLRLMYEAATVQKREVPWDRFRRHLTASGVDLTRRIFQRSLGDLETNYRAIETLLPDLGVPTLVLWGDRDPFFGVSVGERSHRAIPGSVFRVFPETGHFVPEEQPGRVADEIHEFLAAVKLRCT
ncbi:MAG: alpha/beta fold hydrolase [Gemmatimonadales bacterium]